MNASRNIAILRRVASDGVRQERSLHAISSTMDASNEMLLPPPSSSSSSSSQSRPFFVASSSSAIESSLPCRNKPSALAIHRLLSNIGAPTSLRNIECIIQEKSNDGNKISASRDGMTADEMIDLIAQIRSI